MPNILVSIAATAGLALFGAATAANAVTFTGTATGSWTNVQGGGAINTNNNDSGGTADLDWGVAQTTPFNNLWSFDGVGSDGGAGWSTSDNSLFKLGDFDYRNGSVNGHSFTGADLSIDLAFTSPFAASDTYSFAFDVISTPNTGAGCCDDIASIINTSSSQTFSYGGLDYTLSLFGFSQDGGTTLTTNFNSPEGSTAMAALYGKITLAPVPLPAAGWMLLAGLGGLAAMRRRKKAA